MSSKRSIRRSLAVGGLVSGIAVSAQRAVSQRSALRFYRRTPESSEPRRYGTFYGGAPGVFHQSEATWTLHGASLEAVSAVIPTALLSPVRLGNERGLVLVGSLRHDLVTASGVDGPAVPPYGEVLIGIGVSRRAAPPMVPLVAPAWSGWGLGIFVLHLPVTNRVARDAGRGGWGYPKFVADIELEDDLESCHAHLAEGGRTILRQHAWPGSRVRLTGGSLVLYSVHDRQLVEVSLPVSALERRRWGRAGGRLELGDHEVAQELRALEIDPVPFLTQRLTSLRLAMGPGKRLGPAREYQGYAGEELESARYVLTYPGTEPIERGLRQMATIAVHEGSAAQTRPEPPSA